MISNPILQFVLHHAHGADDLQIIYYTIIYTGKEHGANGAKVSEALETYEKKHGVNFNIPFPDIENILRNKFEPDPLVWVKLLAKSCALPPIMGQIGLGLQIANMLKIVKESREWATLYFICH